MRAWYFSLSMVFISLCMCIIMFTLHIIFIIKRKYTSSYVILLIKTLHCLSIALTYKIYSSIHLSIHPFIYTLNYSTSILKAEERWIERQYNKKYVVRDIKRPEIGYNKILEQRESGWGSNENYCRELEEIEIKNGASNLDILKSHEGSLQMITVVRM